MVFPPGVKLTNCAIGHSPPSGGESESTRIWACRFPSPYSNMAWFLLNYVQRKLHLLYWVEITATSEYPRSKWFSVFQAAVNSYLLHIAVLWNVIWYLCTKIHGVTSQKIIMLILTAMKNSNLHILLQLLYKWCLLCSFLSFSIFNLVGYNWVAISFCFTWIDILSLYRFMFCVETPRRSVIEKICQSNTFISREFMYKKLESTKT